MPLRTSATGGRPSLTIHRWHLSKLRGGLEHPRWMRAFNFSIAHFAFNSKPLGKFLALNPVRRAQQERRDLALTPPLPQASFSEPPAQKNAMAPRNETLFFCLPSLSGARA